MNEFTHSFLDSSNDEGLLSRPARAQLGLVSTEPQRTLMLPLPTVKVGQRAYLESSCFLRFHFLCAPH